MSYSAAIWLAIVLLAIPAIAQEPPIAYAEATTNKLYRHVESRRQPQAVVSPDQKFTVIYRQTHPGVYGRNAGRVTVLDQAGRIVASRVLADNGGRLVAVARWSPDSRFCVFTTISANGHSPWQFEPYILSVDNLIFRFLGDSFPAVVNPEFRFAHPHTVLFVTPQGTTGLDLSGKTNHMLYNFTYLDRALLSRNARRPAAFDRPAPGDH